MDERFVGLEFPAAGALTTRSRGRVYLVLAALMATGSAVSIVILSGSLLRQGSGSNPWVIIGSVILLSFVFPFAYFLSMVRDFSVKDGVMTLRLPIRLRSGTKTRRLALGDVDYAERFLWRDGDSGLLIVLKDGSQFRLWKSDFPEGSDQYLESFLAAFGKTSS